MSTFQGFIDPKTYPPTQITTADGVINILQLTDPHLYLDSDTETVGINNYKSFTACLQQALEEDIRCDLILLSGDLVNEVKPEIYQNIYQLLEKTGIPFVCIAGNHDVTDELDTHLPFSERRFVAHKPSALLLSRHCLTLNDWRLLLIDSSVPGKIYGAVGNKNLNWLSQNIANSHHPVIIAMHHHVLPMDSASLPEAPGNILLPFLQIQQRAWILQPAILEYMKYRHPGRGHTFGKSSSDRSRTSKL